MQPMSRLKSFHDGLSFQPIRQALSLLAYLSSLKMISKAAASILKEKSLFVNMTASFNFGNLENNAGVSDPHEKFLFS